MAAGAPAAKETGGAEPPTREPESSAEERITIEGAVPRHLRLGRLVQVRGRVRPVRRGREIALRVSTRGGLRTVDRARTGPDGRFRLSWRPDRPGRFRVRIGAAGSRAARATASRGLNVYRGAHASWYGPGLYGNRLACGGRLGTGTLGVAHKSLPCGTRVTFRYGRRTVTVPVIDRGPFVAGREWDLTGATKRALGFPSTGMVLSTR